MPKRGLEKIYAIYVYGLIMVTKDLFETISITLPVIMLNVIMLNGSC